MSKTFAVILAGGGGTRLGGVRKADLRIGGERLLERVAAAVRDQVDQVLVSVGGVCGLDMQGAVTVADIEDRRMGPLAGIRAAVAYLSARATPDDLLLSVAVDTPFLPADYVARLKEAAGNSGSAYAMWGDDFYPTNAAWRLGVLAGALQRVDETAGPKAILRMLDAVRVDWSADRAANPFANLNTLADLVALQRRAKGL